MKRFLTVSICMLALFAGVAGCGSDDPESAATPEERVSVFEQGETNPLFKEEKVPNYLPHMSWFEIEEALLRTDMVIIPTGSIEQHGKHLPLCTDIYAAIELCKLIAQETDVIIAPSVFAGLSEHHMGFPGTLTFTPATYEAVLYETAQSLIHHGFDKIMIYNGHGGNKVSVANVIEKINQETSATAVFLNNISVPADPDRENIPYDFHAGEGETSSMLYLAGSLVNMSRAERPVLTFSQVVQDAEAMLDEEPNLNLVISANRFRPRDAGKAASSREMSNIGVFTSGDPKNAEAEKGKKNAERFVNAAVKFIEAWKQLSR
ncbi:creatininase family protein [candidate division KSB1 bacterium]